MFAVLIPFAVLGIVGAFFWRENLPDTLTLSGVVEADEARVGSLVGGRVAKVLVEEGTVVKQGDLLVELEPFVLTDRLKEAEARLRAAKAEFTLLEEGFRTEEVEAARAKLAGEEAAFALADKELARAKELYKKNTISQRELDLARKQFESAEASVRESKSMLIQFVEGSRKQEIVRASALVDAHFASLQAIQREIEELKIRAPMSGSVHAIDLVEGDLISANAPVLTIIDLNRIWVRTYLPENELDHHVGEEVALRCDSFPGEAYTGQITFLSSEAEFTPSNLQTKEDRSKQVYRVKIRKLSPPHHLRPGIYCDVTFTPDSTS